MTASVNCVYKLCEGFKDVCASGSHRCKNAATCRFDPSTGTYSCLCATDYTGDYCEITITVPSTHNESLVMVIAISLCILLVFVTLVVVLCVFRQRRYRGKYNPAAVETVGGTAVPLSQMLAADTKEFLI
ncbi:hypothetical protein LSAT2_019620 [Lamellibrachia satsuma]|nr:hypothetical protein LSAT2_019620 [Lamellibrachia satsuma]